MHSASFDPLWIIPKRIGKPLESYLCLPKRSGSHDDPRMEQWWERARRAMKDRGITQSDMAEHFGMTPAGIQKWLSGSREPGLNDLLKIADLLKMPRAELLLGTEQEDDIGDLPEFAREPLRRIVNGARSGRLDAGWFKRFDHALEALDAPMVEQRRRLDYRSAAIGLATALDLREHTQTYATFVRQVDEVVSEHEGNTKAAPQHSGRTTQQ
jgi:transcriptional regulator with XRE-family HTH domain